MKTISIIFYGDELLTFLNTVYITMFCVGSWLQFRHHHQEGSTSQSGDSTWSRSLSCRSWPDTDTSMFNHLIDVIVRYFAWKLSNLKQFQLLGFVQMELLYSSTWQKVYSSSLPIFIRICKIYELAQAQRSVKWHELKWLRNWQELSTVGSEGCS